MKNIGFDFLNYHGKIMISVDSLLESFDKLGNYDALETVEHFTNEFHLHSSGFGDQTNTTFKIKGKQ